MRRHDPTAFTRLEALAVIVAAAALSAMLAPVLAHVGGSSMSTVSRDNLRLLHGVHECYAGDWSGRQWTAVPDDISAYGETIGSACANYAQAFGEYPPMVVGFTCPDGALWGFWPCTLGSVRPTTPLVFEGSLVAAGSFRIHNGWGLHEYLSNRFYDPAYYAPQDTIAFDLAEPAFEDECEFVLLPDVNFVPSSYVLSPAAMYDPDVLRAPSRGGFQHPDTLEHGYRSPSVSQVAFAHLKTRMIEHNWLRGAPGPCNPGFEEPLAELYSPDCSPYLFNHGAEAAPATLFFDGSVERLSTGQVVEDDLRAGKDGLWSRDTPLGETGYFGEHSFDGTIASHHILTTGGILGRDWLR